MITRATLVHTWTCLLFDHELRRHGECQSSRAMTCFVESMKTHWSDGSGKFRYVFLSISDLETRYLAGAYSDLLLKVARVIIRAMSGNARLKVFQGNIYEIPREMLLSPGNGERLWTEKFIYVWILRKLVH